MADFRYLKCQFWTDPYTATLPPAERFYYIWLFTNTHTNQLGMLDVSEGTKSMETGLKPETIKGAEERLERDGKIRKADGVIWIVNFHKHQSTRSPKIRIRIAKELEAMGCHPLAQAFQDRYPDATSQDQDSHEDQEQEIKEKKRKGKERRTVSDTVSDTVSETTPQDGLLSIPHGIPFAIKDPLTLERAEIRRLARKIAEGKHQDGISHISPEGLERRCRAFNQRIQDLSR
jgi:hypothetical protein